jgi:hypothetical protein
MPSRNLLLTDVKFVFRAKIMRRRARTPTNSLYMATAHVEVGAVGRSETHVAYLVKPGRGRPAFEILTHGGRLYWPALRDLGGRPGTTETRLLRLLSWRWDIDAADSSNRPDMEPPLLDADLTWRSIEASGERDALTLLHRRAASCLVVDGEVFAEGGVPLAPRGPQAVTRKHPTLSSGTSRAVLPETAGLGWQPGSFHLRDTHFFLAAGTFGVPPVTDGQVGIVVHRAFPLDPLEVRIDAMFRLAWHKLRTVEKKRQTGAFAEVVDRFSAAESGPASELTPRRCEALRLMMETGYFLGITSEFLRFIAATVQAAERAGTMVSSSDLTDDEIKALAQLGG